MPLASLELPSRAFPSRGAVPALAGHLLPCGFDIRLAAGAEPAGSSRPLSPEPRQFFAARAHPKVDPGLRNCDGGSLRSLVRSPRHAEACRTYRPLPTDTGLAGKRPARPLRSFAPPGSPFRDHPITWPGWGSPSVLSWGSRPPELSPSRFGVRFLAEAHAGGKAPSTCSSRRPAIAVARRDPDSDA
jgi:hypothetical protein